MMWIFIALPAGAQALLVLRLVSTGLAKRYPFLTMWMAFSAISMVALMAYASPQSPGYREVWLARQIITMLVLFGALLELTNRILEHYPGLRRVTASGLFGLLLATSIIATAGESFDRAVHILLIIQSAWNGATCVYVIGLVALATYLDPRRRQNVILHERVFAASCALTAVFMLVALNKSQKEISNWVGAAGGVIFPLLWMRMSPAGEVDRRPPAIIGAPGVSMMASEAKLQRLERMVTRSGD